jgi:hypothetical protein
MSKNFYSSTEERLAEGATNLVVTIGNSAAQYGLTSQIVADYDALAGNFSGKLRIARTPATRTPVAIEEKDIAKAALRSATLNIARIITATPTVTNAQLRALELTQRSTRSPKPVPSVAPMVEVVSVSGRLVTLRIHDAASSTKRGKPAGAMGANIYTYVGSDAPNNPAEYVYKGQATRSTTQVLFPDTVPSGATVWFAACWYNARGEVSQACAPVSVNLPGGPALAAAA